MPTPEHDPEESSDFQGGDADSVELSLAQLILSPVDSLLKAQVHATRSFLNLLLQLGTPHQSVQADGQAATDDQIPYELTFTLPNSGPPGTPASQISVPTLALVPLKPLSISRARFKLAMAVKRVTRFRQLSQSKDVAEASTSGFGSFNRPWHLVHNPVSLVGSVAPRTEPGAANDGSSPAVAQQSAQIDIEVEVDNTPIPEPLDRLLAALGKGVVSELPPPPPPPPAPSPSVDPAPSAGPADTAEPSAPASS